MRIPARAPALFLILSAAIAVALSGCATNLKYVQQPPQPEPMPAPVVAVPPAAPAPAPAPMPVAAIERVSISSVVTFNPGSAVLTAASMDKLNEFRAKAAYLNVEVIVIVGHTDDTLKAPRAQALSVRRAQAVKDYLVARGTAADKVYVEGKGNTQPIADNKTAAGRASNNRADLDFLGTRRADGIANVWIRNNLVPVLFATNRNRTGKIDPFNFYGNLMADPKRKTALEHGVALVRIPPQRERGTIKTPSWTTLTIQRLSDEAGISNVPAMLLPNPKTDFLFEQRIHVMKADEFKQALKEAVSKSDKKTAILYVHGFNNSFTDAAFRTAQLTYDLAEEDFEYVPLMFSWPSNPGASGVRYNMARNRTVESGKALAEYLKEIAQTTNIGTVHIVAHSMGSQVLGNAIKALGEMGMSVAEAGGRKPIFHHIVFAAPDISPQMFTEFIEPAIRTRHTLTTYISSNDKVLLLSKIRNWELRVGSDFSLLTKCVDTIDVTVESHGLAHSTWAESPRVLDDLRGLLRYSIAPSKRGLLEDSATSVAHWAFVRKIPEKMPGYPEKERDTLKPCDPIPVHLAR
jgi:esterase/lipase superfamily enzyme/outer membrane protein OmpA-like peptidoglycan-associated protein